MKFSMKNISSKFVLSHFSIIFSILHVIFGLLEYTEY